MEKQRAIYLHPQFDKGKLVLVIIYISQLIEEKDYCSIFMFLFFFSVTVVILIIDVRVV